MLYGEVVVKALIGNCRDACCSNANRSLKNIAVNNHYHAAEVVGHLSKLPEGGAERP